MTHQPDPPDLPEPVRLPAGDLDDIAAAVRRLTARSESHSQLLDQLADDPWTPPTGPAAPGVPAAPPSAFIVALDGDAYEAELAALTTWVDEVLLPVYGRAVSAQAPWCPWWHEHPEAVARLHGLWLAWQQHIAPESGLAGPAVWHRDHLDHVWAQLRSPTGPFSACTTHPRRPAHRVLPSPESTRTQPDTDGQAEAAAAA
ncbi:DUF4913 domain-containing protein [Streptomyces carpaticus]|uniref:DUF4913 domain-containing protein n=1 Tax=Streptomyces carpaticus TaxID=285558 RepID=UPI002209A280|nr:DUF4913 domain-containing protein [Streptomyces carpaticus]